MAYGFTASSHPFYANNILPFCKGVTKNVNVISQTFHEYDAIFRLGCELV